jgi:uncharacterized damage-inducible protein DinB
VDSRLQSYLDTFERESDITLKVLRAYPADQGEWKPHERSNSARVLAWTFVVEQRLAVRALREGQVLGANAAAGMPDTFAGAVVEFERARQETIDAVRGAADARVDSTVQFYGGPKQLADYAMMDFLWFLLHDQIHHRGQLSVYLRMAGGKVPSIYGPSADEPWN